ILGPGPMADALGDLRHRHPSGGQVLHQRGMDAGLAGQAVNALGPPSVEPALQVLDQHPGVPPRALEGYGPGRHLHPPRAARARRTGQLAGSAIAGTGGGPVACRRRKGSAAVFMWKMWATQARMNPCSASHSLSARIAAAATRLTSGSALGSAVAMPPMGTAP